MLRAAIVLTTAIGLADAGAVQENQGTMLVVLDADTGEPVTTFGVEVWSADSDRLNWGTEAIHDARILAAALEHPAGECRVDALPSQHQFRLVAPGYGRAERPVQYDHDTPGRMTVRLRRAATVHGRALLGREPIAARFVLRSSLVRLHEEEGVPGEPYDEADMYWAGPLGPADPFWLEVPATRGDTDERGRFEIGLLPPGDYRLEIETPRGEHAVVDPLTLGAGDEQDVGDVVLARVGRIEGRIVVRGGVSAKGWQVSDYFRFHSPRRCPIDDAGLFALDEVPAGNHRLTISSGDNPMDSNAVLVVVVPPEGVGRVEWDVTPFLKTHLTLRVWANDQFAVGALVDLETTSIPIVRGRIGPLDRTGAAGAFTPTLGEVRARVTSSLGVPLGSAVLPIRLEPGGRRFASIDLNPAALNIRWPAPARSPAVLRVNGVAASGETFELWIGREAIPGLPRAPVLLDDRCDIGWIAAGEYDLAIELFDATDSRLGAYRAHVGLAPGSPSDLVLTERDRVKSD